MEEPRHAKPYNHYSHPPSSVLVFTAMKEILSHAAAHCVHQQADSERKTKWGTSKMDTGLTGSKPSDPWQHQAVGETACTEKPILILIMVRVLHQEHQNEVQNPNCGRGRDQRCGKDYRQTDYKWHKKSHHTTRELLNHPLPYL